MLEKFLYNQTSSNFILIVDGQHVNGTSLLCSFIKNYSTVRSKLHVVLYENNPQEIHALAALDCFKVVVHDFYTDPLGWNDESSVDALQDLSEVINTDCDDEALIVIDSLSPLLRNCSTLNCSWILQSLKNHKNIKCIIALFHSHLHTSQAHGAISYLANTVINLTDEHQKLSSTSGSSYINKVDKSICTVIHQKQNGKVVTSDEEFEINGETLQVQVSSWYPFSKNEIEQKSKDIEPQSFDETNVTFNLNLSKEEEAERKKLIMPYTKVQIEESNSGSQIFYEPDKSDLYEDDPDEDLDF